MRPGRLLLAGLTTTTLLGVSVAHAADEIGLSDDGVTWSSGLDAPLFDPDVRWVPGDSRTESFYVRNEGPSGASLTIEARSADEDDLLADDDIDLRARADGGAWVALRNGVASTRLTEREIEQDGVVEVDVNATFDPTSTNQSQVRRLALDFRVLLADAAGTDGESDADADGGTDADLDGPGVDADLDPPAGEETTGALPGTGTTTERWILLLGAALVVGGTSLVVRRRDREGAGR